MREGDKERNGKGAAVQKVMVFYNVCGVGVRYRRIISERTSLID
tara:strand:+ start:1878 stop:2009 length:132 start_codon:yes stop_codon:yes gene_type:complete